MQIRAVEYLDGVLGDELFPYLGDCDIIITADHAELFGEDGYFGHGIGIPHINMLNVPLVIGKNPW